MTYERMIEVAGEYSITLKDYLTRNRLKVIFELPGITEELYRKELKSHRNLEAWVGYLIEQEGTGK